MAIPVVSCAPESASDGQDIAGDGDLPDCVISRIGENDISCSINGDR
jgi:hypothetical protein